METVSLKKWRLALSILALTLIAGVALPILLALGLTDLIRAPQLIWQADGASNWALVQSAGEFDLYRAPIPLPQPPFTLELSAGNQGQPSSAWGLWLEIDGGIQTFVVSSEGYISISNDEMARWAEFFHVHPTANKLYLHIEADHSAAFRINDEIAWTGRVNATHNWGIAIFRNPQLVWGTISLYGVNGS